VGFAPRFRDRLRSPAETDIRLPRFCYNLPSFVAAPQYRPVILPILSRVDRIFF
jgi:hypothetical protein